MTTDHEYTDWDAVDRFASDVYRFSLTASDRAVSCPVTDPGSRAPAAGGGTGPGAPPGRAGRPIVASWPAGGR